MATGQSVLNLMEDLFPELQLQSGETDVTKGLRVLNAAQDLFETLAARHPGFLGGSIGTVSTTKNTEATTYPTGLLRLDGLDYIDTDLDPDLPTYPIEYIRQRGGHRYNRPWLWNFAASKTSGKPRRYWDNGTNIYWDPIPDAIYTVRWYGFQAASNITAAGTFAYPDAAMLPLGVLTIRIIRGGLDDPTQDYISLAKETLDPLIDALSDHNKDMPHGMRYTYSHDT